MREKPSESIHAVGSLQSSEPASENAAMREIITILDEQAQQIAELEAWRESVKGQLLDDNQIRG